MHSFINLLSRLDTLNEAKDSPMDRIMPGFQGQARALAKSKGASSGTREGRLAMLGILFDLDIIDDSVVRMFKNDPSVSRMVDYFESNGIAKQIKNKRDEIQAHIKDQLENKVSFTTGNRTDAAQQRYEVNKLNNEIRAAKKVARLERKKETASAMSSMRQTVDMYDDLIGSLEQSYSNEYMIEIVADRDSDLSDINNIVKYLSKFVDESDIEVEGRSIDAVFSPSSKLGKIISKMGIEKIERQIADDLKPFGGAGIVIHEPDSGKKEVVGDLRTASSIEDEEGYEEEAEGESDKYLNKLKKDLEQATGEPVNVVKESNQVEGTALYLEKVDFKRLAKGVGAAAGLAGAVVGGANLAQNFAKPVGSAISSAVSDITAGGSEAFLSRLDEEDRKEAEAALEELRITGKMTEMGRKTDQYLQADSNIRKLEDRLRKDYNIPANIRLTESKEVGTECYLVEQTNKDSVRRSDKQQAVAFKERYKPKTSYQLEELRRYGL